MGALPIARDSFDGTPVNKEASGLSDAEQEACSQDTSTPLALSEWIVGHSDIGRKRRCGD